MSLPAIQGVIGAVTGGTSIVNAFLVVLQKVNFDVKGEDDVAFLFAYREEDMIELRSDITDHFTEGNSALQDEIALKPIEANLHGFIGELSDQQTGILQEIQLIASQLTVFAPYVPQLTVAALAAYNQAQQIYNVAASAAATITQAYDLVVGNDAQTKQQKAYAFFKQKWLDRELFTVQTPWEILTNMAILNVRAIQEGESNTISDFRVAFKQMRFASTISNAQSIAQGRRQAQSALQVSQGAQNPPAIGAPNFGGDNSGVFTA